MIFPGLNLSQKVISFFIISTLSLIIYFNTPPKLKYFFSNPEYLSIEPIDVNIPEVGNSEIWIAELNIDGDQKNLHKIKLPNGWIYKDNSIVFLGNSENSKEGLTLKYQNFIDIKFLKHRWSGQVRIKASDATKIVDLHDSVNGYFIQNVSSRFTVFKFISNVLLMIIIMCVLVYLVDIFIKIEFNQSKASIFSLTPIFFSMIVIWIFYLLSYYPGLMSPDSFDQWNQAMNFTLNDWHPVFHTLIIWSLTRVWKSPAVVVIFHLVILTITLLITFKILVRLKINQIVLVTVLIFITISPVNGMMLITLWKDIPYSISLLFFSVILLEILQSNGGWIDINANKAILLFSLLSLSLLRHNGIPVAILTYFTLLFVRISHKKDIIKIGAVYLIILLVFKIPVYNFLKVTRTPKYLKSLMVLQTLSPLVVENKLNVSDMSYLNNIYPINEWKKSYDPCSTNYITFSDSFNRDFINKNELDFYKRTLSIIYRHPIEMISSILKMNSTILKIRNPSFCYYYTTFTKIEEYNQSSNTSSLQNKYKLRTSPVLKYSNIILANLLDISFEKNTSLFFWRPVIDLMLILFFGLVFVLKTNSRNIIVFFPLILNIISLVITIPGQDYRYYYSLHLALVLIPLAFINNYKKV